MSLDRYDRTPPGLARKPGSLLELLVKRAELHGSHRAVVDIDRAGGESASLTYSELGAAALGVARQLELQSWGGRPVLLSTSNASSFAVGFFAVLAAGGSPVPVALGRGPGAGKVLARIAQDCSAAGLLVDDPISSRTGAMLKETEGAPDLGIMSPQADRSLTPPDLHPGDTALIQYTSGATFAPKGVTVTHENLMHNLSCIQAWITGDAGSNTVGWLPLYHDMGLIGLLLYPIFSGGTAILMKPTDFVTQPLRWAQAFTHYRGQQSATPNFGIELLVRAARAKGTEGLDLSSIQGIANGAEPVRASTLADAVEVLGPVGLSPDALTPCYGMAESTLIASAPDRPRTTLLKADRAAIEEGYFTPDQGTGDWREFVSCGHALPESELLIVDPKMREVLAEDRIGEVWLRGPSVASGYLHGPGDSFGAVTSDGRGDCLRTGDLGFLHDGELYLSGRSKDLIVIAGRNIHPTDLEWTAEHAHPLITPNSTAAFAVEGEDSEEPILLVELRGGADDEDALRAVRSAITSEHDCDLRAIIPMDRGSIPRTTSGKARRATCKKLYESGRLSGAKDNAEMGAKET